VAGKAHRKLGLFDAMILIAAIAVWLAAIRYFGPPSDQGEFGPIWTFGDGGWVRVLERRICLLLLTLSLATLLIRFRSPRPGRRRMWAQPGVTACAAALLGVLANGVSEALYHHVALSDWENFIPWAFWYQWPNSGPAVAGAWLTLLWTRTWRGERSAIDRLGRLIGACWLLEFLLAELPGRRWVSIIGQWLFRVTP
jgi:hypothetical protein